MALEIIKSWDVNNDNNNNNSVDADDDDKSAIADGIDDIDCISNSVFEPLSDSCGESDMEGLDFSMFEPHHIDTDFRQPSRVYTGTLDLLISNYGKDIINFTYYLHFLFFSFFLEKIHK